MKHNIQWNQYYRAVSIECNNPDLCSAPK